MQEDTGLIFLYGALRSGSTVFRLMLDAHPAISCSGEVDFIFEHLRKQGDGWTYHKEGLSRDWIYQESDLGISASDNGRDVVLNFVNQLKQRSQGRLVLVVHRNLEKIAAIFPDAKIIHLIRDPRDVAISCIGMGWAGTTYYAVNNWLEVESDWDRFGLTFQKDAVLEVLYERLISDTAGQLSEICTFVGVPFSATMLNYPNHSTYEAPDLSTIQRWKNAHRAEDIALLEVRAKQLLLQRRYELSGYPLNPPTKRERVRIWWENKRYKWKFGLRRYGHVNFIMEKITRKFARPFHPMFHRRMHKIWKQHLK